jgi:uncharacterized protein HemX
MDQTQSPFPQQPAPRSGNIGPLAAAIVIVLLVAAGGFYFLQSEQRRQAAQDAAQAAQAQNEQATASPDSTTSIESDLNATQTTGASGDVDNLNGAL